MGIPTPSELLMRSHQEFESHDYLAARASAEKALATYQDGPPRLLGLIRFHLGMVARTLGDTATALVQFSTFIDETKSVYPDLASEEWRARYYRALTYRQRGEYSESVAEYRLSLEIAPSEFTTKITENLGWTYCLACDVREAKRLPTSDSVDGRLNVAFITLLEGNFAATKSITNDLLAKSLDNEQRAQAAWLNARACLGTSDHNAAYEMAKVASVAATESGDARLMNDVAALQRMIRIGA